MQYANSTQQKPIPSLPLQVRQHEAVIRLLGPQNIVTSVADEHAAERPELEAFVRQAFVRKYGANIKRFMPLLMSLRDDTGNLLAVCGIRHATASPLFLEQYLGHPIETTLSDRIHYEVARSAIVEVGNLAVLDPASIRSLLASVSLYLHKTCSEWAVFTGVPSLRNSLLKLNMQPALLGHAKLDHLPEEERADWGSYYEQNPLVMAIQR